MNDYQPSQQSSPPPPPPIGGYHSQQKMSQSAGQMRPIQKESKAVLPGCLLGGLLTLLVLSLIANVSLLVALVFAGNKGFASVASTKTVGSTDFVEYTVDGPRSKNKIAIIELYGIISYDIAGSSGLNMVDEVIAKLRFAAEDNSVKAVILDIDSPGGEVNASDVLYNEIKKVRDEHNKPVVAHFRSVAASGAYYAAMGSTKIVANRMTITGSIGVILQTLQYKGLFERVGLRTFTFKSGKFKDLLNPERDPSKEEIDLVQNLVMGSYEVFASIVETERGFTNSANFRENIADGRIFSGSDALQANIVDQLGYFEDAQKQALNLAGLSEAQFVSYEAVPSLSRLFRILGVEAKKEINVKLNGLTENFQLTPGKIYFLLPTFVVR